MLYKTRLKFDLYLVHCERDVRHYTMKLKVSSVYFILKILIILPVTTLFHCLDVWYHYSRTITPSFIRRVLMREAFLLGNSATCADVINPVFEYINSFFLQDYEEIGNYMTEDDYQLILPRLKMGSPLSFGKKYITTKYVWYSKPAHFDPDNDPVLVFSHGGGFAIKLVPLSFNFLNNLSKYFPRMGIIIHDYTVSVDEDGEHPLNLLETTALYDYITKDLNCKHVTLVGESAGGNIILGTLQFLQNTGRVLPEKVIVLSPWCNPTYDSSHSDLRSSLAYSINKVMDALSFEGLGTFTKILTPKSYVYEDDPMLDIESNFADKTWDKILAKVSLLVVYGTDEILQHEIKDFIKKLDNLRSNNFTLADNVTIDENGGHIEPVLNMTLNLEKWSEEPTIASILDFLKPL